MGFDLNVSISGAAVFIQGILSFFSPCVLPLLPLYFGYLSGGSGDDGALESSGIRRRRILIHTVCFVAGIGFAFFLLGMGMAAAGRLLSGHRLAFARIGGVLIILLGLFQLGLFQSGRIGSKNILMREHRLKVNVNRMRMSPVTAWIMGFVFSFAWTPCIGPALSSVLIMAGTAGTRGQGFGYIALYTLGFVIPFLVVGLAADTILGLLARHRGVVRYTAKIGAILLIIMGVLMLTGGMNRISGWLGRFGSSGGTGSEAGIEAETETETETAFESEPITEPMPQTQSTASETTEQAEPKTKPSGRTFDFDLVDQYGERHTLSDYKGKIIFLNFWATWCPPCREEMPDIQTLYERYQADPESDVVILGVAMPGFGGESDAQGIADFLEENGYTYPVMMDETGELASYCQITAIPTTFMVDEDGEIYGYITGMLSLDMMEEIIRQTRGLRPSDF